METPELRLVSLDREIKSLRTQLREAEKHNASPARLAELGQKLAQRILERKELAAYAAGRILNRLEDED